MSDLIERLEAFQEKSEIYAGCDENDEIWQDCGKYVLENLPAFLSALKTVREIEAAKRILIEWDEANNLWRVNTYTSEGWFEGTTLAAAVEAAGKKQ